MLLHVFICAIRDLPQPGAALGVLKLIAAERDAPLHVAGED